MLKIRHGKHGEPFLQDTPFYREYSEKVLINSMIIAYFTIFAL